MFALNPSWPSDVTPFCPKVGSGEPATSLTESVPPCEPAIAPSAVAVSVNGSSTSGASLAAVTVRSTAFPWLGCQSTSVDTIPAGKVPRER